MYPDMNIFKKILGWVSDFDRVFRNELKLIVRDPGILLFFIVLPLAYPIVYTLIYNPEVVRKLPIAVVDNSRTAESRNLVQKASASPSIDIYAYCSNMADAKHLMAEGEVFGIMQIPDNYAKNIGIGEPAHVEFYAEMSLLLRYRTLLSAITDLQLEVISEITGERISSSGLSSLAGGSGGMPVKSSSNFLGNPEQGFASAIIPGIVIFILQQSMILGICMIGGTSRERRMRNGGVDPKAVVGVSAMSQIWGKSLAYVLFYIPMTLYVTVAIPAIFRFPAAGSPIEYMIFMIPMLFATSFLGQTIAAFMKERETGFLVIVFTSVVFLFLSGLTWPRYAMSDFWYWLGNLVPGTWGVEGFILMNNNGASLPEVSTAFVSLWILLILYMITAVLVVKLQNSKNHGRD